MAGLQTMDPSRTPHPVIQVLGIRKTYGATVAVSDVSFEVNEGEIFGLIGPNGAGKTTTMECVEGVRRPDCGKPAAVSSAIRITDQTGCGASSVITLPMVARQINGSRTHLDKLTRGYARSACVNELGHGD